MIPVCLLPPDTEITQSAPTFKSHFYGTYEDIRQVHDRSSKWSPYRTRNVRIWSLLSLLEKTLTKHLRSHWWKLANFILIIILLRWMELLLCEHSMEQLWLDSLKIFACDGLPILHYDLLMTGSLKLLIYKSTLTIPIILHTLAISRTNMSQTSVTWVITGYAIDHHLFDYLSAHVLNINVEVTVD